MRGDIEMTLNEIGKALIIVGLLGIVLCVGIYLLFPTHFGNESTSVIESVVASVESEINDNSTSEEILSSIESNCQKLSDNPKRCNANLLKIYNKKIIKASIGVVIHET